MGDALGILSQSTQWRQVLASIGLPPESAVRPSWTRCPCCSRKNNQCLLILSDPLSGEQWHWCKNCGSQGPIAALLCKYWKISPEKLPEHLQPFGIDKSASAALLRDEESRRQGRLHACIFPRDWHTELRSSPAGGLLARFALDEGLCGSAWIHTIGRLVGTCNKSDWQEELEAFPAERKAALWGRTKKNGATQAVLLPLRDLPGRIVALLTYVAAAESGTLHELEFTTTAGAAVKLGGLLFHPDTATNTTYWKSQLLAVPDPLFHVQLAARGLAFGDATLPLVSWSPNATSPSGVWSIFAGRPVVFWGAELSAAVLEQAVRTEGRISDLVWRLDSPSDEKEIWRRDPYGFVSQALSATSEWPAALDKYFRRKPDAALGRLLFEYALRGNDLQVIRDRVSKEFANRISRVEAIQNRGRTVPWRGKLIVDRPDGWYAIAADSGREELVTDVKLSLDEAVVYAGGDTTILTGEATFRGKTLPFAVAENRLEQDGAGVVRKIVAAEGLGYPKVATGWSRQLLGVSQMFKQPKLRVQSCRVGWDPNTGAFVFPHFNVVHGGSCLPLHAALPRKRVPAADVKMPETLTPTELEQLLVGSDEQVLTKWLAASAVLASLISTSAGDAFGGLVVAGRNRAATLGATLRAMGALSAESPRGQSHIAGLEKTVLADDWPLYVDLTAVRPSVAADVSGLQRSRVRGLSLICGVPQEYRDVFAVSPHWRTASVSEDVRTVPEISPAEAAAWQQLVPNYLLHSGERYWQFVEPRTCGWLTSAAADLLDFLTTRHVDTSKLSNLLETCRDYERPDQVTVAFVRLLRPLLASGQLLCRPYGFHAETAAQVKDLEVLLPKQHINDCLRKTYGRDVLSFEFLTRHLPHTENSESSADYLSVPLTWWNAVMRDVATRRTENLAVIG